VIRRLSCALLALAAPVAITAQEPDDALRTPIPPVTPADRAAAQPPQGGEGAHDDTLHGFLLVDQLEWRRARADEELAWKVDGWAGSDLNRLWLRSEGEHGGSGTESAVIEVFYGRSVSTWWDLLAGLRHDAAPGPSRSFAAIGVQGLAPQWFETSLTAYVGEGRHAGLQLEVEYELLLTNRLILQPMLEVALWTRDDPERKTGSGLSKAEGGLRLRYEITRRFAPYIGVSHARAFGGTADLWRADSGHRHATSITAGLRFWF
jgi:copper resistance protein B